MATATIKMSDDFFEKVKSLEKHTDDILPKVLESAASVMEEAVRASLSSVIGKNTKEQSRSTGELLSALGISSSLQDRDGNWNVKIGFAEPRADGKSNAMLANLLEYGKHGQASNPFLKPAKIKMRKACIQTMKEKLESEVSKI